MNSQPRAAMRALSPVRCDRLVAALALIEFQLELIFLVPDGPPDATGLTPRQQRVLATIKDSIEKRGYPPSMREIGQAVGLTSSSSVAHQLRVLEEKVEVEKQAAAVGRRP